MYSLVFVIVVGYLCFSLGIISGCLIMLRGDSSKPNQDSSIKELPLEDSAKTLGQEIGK